MAIKKYARKVARKVGKAVKGRYFKGKGYSKPRIANMVRDINTLKSMVNAEKKRNTVSSINNNVGQVSVNASGHYIVDVTPNPTQGTGYNNKTGNSIKWHSSHYDFQIYGQSANVSGIKLKFEWVKVIGLPYSSLNDIFGKYIVPNPFITGGTIYDVTSSRDPDYFKNFQVVKRTYATLRPDVITGDIPVKQFSVGFKLRNHHVRNNDNDPTLSMGQIFLIVTADRGNWGASNSTCAGLSNTLANSGAFMSWERTDYYYDN